MCTVKVWPFTMGCAATAYLCSSDSAASLLNQAPVRSRIRTHCLLRKRSSLYKQHSLPATLEIQRVQAALTARYVRDPACTSSTHQPLESGCLPKPLQNRRQHK